MLGKLLKHEIRATAHTMLPLYGLLLLVAALTNVALRTLNGKDVPAPLAILFTILIIVFGVGMMAVGLVTVFAMVQRFRKNLLRDEGYVMHTLPVSIHAHIWAKVLVATLWYALAAVVFVLSALLVAADADFVHDMANVFLELMKSLGNLQNTEILAELLGLMVLGSVYLSLMIYASLAVGHAFSSPKMLWSILTFLGLVFATSLAVYALNSLSGTILDGLIDAFYDGFAAMTAWRALCALTAGYLILFSGAYYGITVWFMRHRLNLE